MRLKYTKDVAVSLAIFYLKVIGFWFAFNRVEECIRSFMMIYTILMVLFCLWIQMRGLYFCWGDFTICTYIGCNSLGLAINMVKFGLLFVQKEKFFQLIELMQKNFWHSNYDPQEKQIFDSAKRTCIYFVCVFSFFSQFTLFCYTIRPAVVNIGRNASDRVLIFQMWLDLPLSTTPYFEITYLLQALSLYQSDVAYLCFDNIFCIMCLHAAGQFRVLQYKMTNIHIVRNNNQNNFSKDVSYFSDECFIAFRNCIRQHQALIEFCALLEEVFSVIVLGQVIMFSMLVCLVGYQIFLVDLNPSMRVTLTSFLSANMCQLWMFTYSCDTMTRESLNVAVAVYGAPWTHLPTDKYGKMIRKDLQLVIMRSRRGCHMTACRFFPISIETYTSIMSTSMSYFTLLKQRTIDAADT
ncbi:odorant receptor Or2-like [Osmia bicornis bicornis]|uniref:odorant receptor Or2-like n=1 Tax=Osmia bicornis bicornis TaxID=1437191 RepID=UPI001EAEA192|nr:odorant receptor Or2-like [Osmia bicornis bicornis]